MLNLDKNTMLDLSDLNGKIRDIAYKYDPRYPQLPSDDDVEAYCALKNKFFSDKDFYWYSQIKRNYINPQSLYVESTKTYTIYDSGSEKNTVIAVDLSSDEIDRFFDISYSYDELSDIRDVLKDQISGVARYVVTLFIGRSMDFYKEKAQRRDLYGLMTKIVDLYRKCNFEDVDKNVDYIYGVLTTYRYAYGHDFYEDTQDKQEEIVKKSPPDLKDLRKRRGTARPVVK